MKKIALSVLLGSTMLFAALSPEHQNIKDLDTMVAYIKSHPKVAVTLRKIDISGKIIYFSAGCKVVFKRKASSNPSGMVGPAEPLEVKRTTCL